MRYTAVDNETGEKIQFEWHEPAPPTDSDILEIQAAYRQSKQIKPSVGGFVSNVIKNYPEAIKGMASGMKELVRPMGSENDPLATALAGGISKLIPDRFKKPGAKEAEATFEAATKGMKETYSHPLKYAYERPVEAALDLSTILAGAGKGAGAVGLPKVASALSKTSKAIEPISGGLKVIGATSRGIKKATGAGGRYVAGIMTGKGKEMPKEAFLAAKAGGVEKAGYINALRGNIRESELAEHFRGAFQQIKDKASAEYGIKLSAMEENNFGLPVGTSLDITPVYNKIAEIRKRFRLDRGITTLPPNEAKDFQQITEMIAEWDKNPYGKTPIGMDSLKQQLDNFYVPSKRIGVVATELRNTVKSELDKLPGYKEMTAKYEKTAKFLKQADKALSLNQKASYDTMIRKIFQGMKEDKDLRRDLTREMQEITGRPLLAEAAGASFNDWAPENLVGRGLAAGELLSIGYGVASKDPTLALVNAGLLGMSSPRVMGETLNILGTGSRWLDKTRSPMLGATNVALSPSMNRLMFQLGKFGDYYKGE